jgi:hypothetical protein
VPGPPNLGNNMAHGKVGVACSYDEVKSIVWGLDRDGDIRPPERFAAHIRLLARSCLRRISRGVNITPPHGEPDLYHDSLRLGGSRAADSRPRWSDRLRESGRALAHWSGDQQEQRFDLQELPEKLQGGTGRVQDEVGGRSATAFRVGQDTHTRSPVGLDYGEGLFVLVIISYVEQASIR